MKSFSLILSLFVTFSVFASCPVKYAGDVVIPRGHCVDNYNTYTDLNGCSYDLLQEEGSTDATILCTYMSRRTRMGETCDHTTQCQ